MQVRLQVEQPQADAERVDRLTTELRHELLDLDVDDVTAERGGPPPEGARAVDVAAAGALLVVMQRSIGLAAQVIATVRAWLRGDTEGRTVRLQVGDHKLELTGVSGEQQERLIDEFLRTIEKG